MTERGHIPDADVTSWSKAVSLLGDLADGTPPPLARFLAVTTIVPQLTQPLLQNAVARLGAGDRAQRCSAWIRAHASAVSTRAEAASISLDVVPEQFLGFVERNRSILDELVKDCEAALAGFDRRLLERLGSGHLADEQATLLAGVGEETYVELIEEQGPGPTRVRAPVEMDPSGWFTFLGRELDGHPVTYLTLVLFPLRVGQHMHRETALGQLLATYEAEIRRAHVAASR